MVQIVDGGSVVFDADIYVPPSNETINYLQSVRENYQNRLATGARDFYGSIVERVTGYDYDKLKYMAQAVVRTVDNMWMDDVIQPLYEIGHYQHAPQQMVRWLMAEPNIRQLYHNGEAEGYGERYVDANPGMIGEDHHDWQVVMDGVVEEDEDGHDMSTEYFYESNPQYDPEFDELNINDTANIMRSWAYMAEYALAKREDPTSKWNAQL